MKVTIESIPLSTWKMVCKKKINSVSYKSHIVKYADECGNRNSERHFEPSPTEKMIRT